MNKTVPCIISILVIILVILGAWYGTRAMRRNTMTADDTSLTAVPNDSVMAGLSSDTPNPLSTANTQTNSQEKKSMSIATFTTNFGTITIALDTAHTPKTVENFTTLASKGFYDGTRFHRVIKGFMIQGGDPLSKDVTKKTLWGTGGPGYQFADEIAATNNNAVGTIAMANAGPNTNGSQFFINVADNGFLNTKHTVFGHVTAGMDVVNKIVATATDASDKPLSDVIVTSITVK